MKHKSKVVYCKTAEELQVEIDRLSPDNWYVLSSFPFGEGVFTVLQQDSNEMVELTLRGKQALAAMEAIKPAEIE